MEPIKLVLCRWVTSRLRPGQMQFLIWVIWRWRSPSQVKQFKRNEISVTVKLLTRPKYVNDSLIYQNCPILNKCICTDYRHYINSLNMLHKGINVINVIVSIFTSSQSTLSVSNCTSQTCVSSVRVNCCLFGNLLNHVISKYTPTSSPDFNNNQLIYTPLPLLWVLKRSLNVQNI